MNKAIAVGKLVRDFERGHQWTPYRIRLHFGVCERTAGRWLEEINAQIVALAQSEDGAWRKRL